MGFIRRNFWRAGRLGVIREPLNQWRHRDTGAGDVYVASYPRSGNTWLRFIIYDLITGREPSFGAVLSGVPHVGKHRGTEGILPGGHRVLKTHEAYRRGYKRAVYVFRDVRDVVISEHRFQLMSREFDGSLDAFIDRFIQGHANTLLRWDRHVESWLSSPINDGDRLLLLSYEQMRREEAAAVAQLAAFFGVEVDDAAIERIVARTALSRMRSKEDERMTEVGAPPRGDFRFVNRGVVGGWSDVLSDEQAARLVDVFGDAMERFGAVLGDRSDR